MREMKFRVWDKEKKQMSEPETLQSIILGAEKFNQYGELEIMQYTGLKDKHGKEIYEGDLLRWHDETLRVIWRTVGWVLLGPLFKRLGTKDGPCSEFNTMGYIIQSEVVGNIYENPELLAPNHE